MSYVAICSNCGRKSVCKTCPICGAVICEDCRETLGHICKEKKV